MDWKNKKIWAAGGAVAIIAIVLCVFLFARQAREVNVIEFKGSVEVERPSISEQLSVFMGMRLEEGDFIQTGKASNVTMTIDQNKIVKLAENSRASFHEVAEGKGGQVTSIYLESGTLINDIKEKLSDNATYNVKTPNATVSVRGTYFVVSVGPEDGYVGVVTKINVYDGSVEVENMDGEVVILYAGENHVADGSIKQETRDSVLLLPSGNHALVGAKKMVIYDYVDYSGLDESDLKRLEELIKEGKSPITLEEIDEYRKKLLGQVEEEPIEPTTVEVQKEEDTEAEAVLPAAEKEVNPSKESVKAKDTEEQPSVGQADTKAPEEGFIDKPKIEVIPVPPAKPSTGTGSNSSGDNNTGGSASPAPPEEPPTPPAPPEENFDSLLLQITNLTEIEGQMTDLQSKISIMEEIANESGDTDWTLNVQQAKTDMAKTQGIMNSVVKVNDALALINALPQPPQITEGDRAGVAAARGAYEGLSGEEKGLVPESSLKKIAVCEGKL